MSDIFLATLGRRPEAITVALDRLADHYPFAEVVILHTEPQHSAIATAFKELRDVFSADYPALRVNWRHLMHENGEAILDIGDQRSADAYLQAVFRVLAEYKANDCTLHLLVAGGRKAMSIYATLAATLIFGPRDRVWTVLSPDEMVDQRGMFHIPPGLRDRVQVVDLPVIPSRLTAAERAPAADPRTIIARHREPRTTLLERLAPAERELALLLDRHPRKTNAELAAILNKEERTVENQFRAIYQKLADFYNIDGPANRKRAVLIEVLAGRG